MPDDTVAQTIDTYNKIAHEYAEMNARFAPTKELEKFVSKLPPAGEILDAGCSAGRDVKYFVQAGFTVTGVDLSGELLKIARMVAPTATYIQQDLRNLQFPDGSFDGIWCSTSIYHLGRKEILDAMKKFYAILRPNGVLYISVKQGTGEAMVAEERSIGMPRHVTYYTASELSATLEKAGFTVEEMYTGNEKDIHPTGRDLTLIMSFSRKKA